MSFAFLIFQMVDLSNFGCLFLFKLMNVYWV